MLVTMLTAMYVMVRVVESIGGRFARQPDEPAPYMLSQPLPWQIHFVSRRSSKAYDEFEGYRRNSIGVYRKNPASMAIASASLAIPCFLSCPESNGSTTTNGTGPLSPTEANMTEADKAAATIQNQFRKYKKQKECK